MVRQIAIAVLFLAVSLPSEENNHPNVAQNKANEQNRSSSGHEDKQTRTPDANSANDDSPKWYTSPEWLLVILGFPTLFFIGWQSWETRKAARATKESVTAIQNQLPELQKSAKAAERSAEVAAQTLELYISKERAWLRIAVEPFSIPADFRGNEEPLPVEYAIQHFGPTDAIITDSTTKAVLSDSNEVPTDSELIGLGPESQVVKPSQPPLKCSQPVWRESDLMGPTVEDAEMLKQGTKFLHFWGFWNYNDVFGKPHTTRFRFLWQKSPFQFGQKGRVLGYWQRHGPQRDNSET